MKLDLSALTIVVPFRYDFPQRRENLETVLRFFDHFFDHLHVVVIETGAPTGQDLTTRYPWLAYHFLPSESTFHRTRYFNMGAKLSTRELVACYDTDVLFRPAAIMAAMSYLQSDPSHWFCFPYNGQFWTVSGEFRAQIMETFNFDQVAQRSVCVHPMSQGGATMFRRAEFLSLGGYNEKFISWGWEDNEIVTRFSRLGCPPYRVPGEICVHLDHPRGENSSDTHGYFQQNFKEFRRVFRMVPSEVCRYIEAELGGSLSPEIVRRASRLDPPWGLRWLFKLWWRVRV